MQMNRLALAVLCSALVSPAVFAEKIQGNFVASKDCDAYQSTKKLNNPDNAAIQSGQSYELIERNKADNPSWYQVRVPDATPAERWVASDCGKADISKASSASSSGACVLGRLRFRQERRRREMRPVAEYYRQLCFRGKLAAGVLRVAFREARVPDSRFRRVSGQPFHPTWLVA